MSLNTNNLSVEGDVYDAIVVGAGGMGGAAAYRLASAGASVLVLEQFKTGHTQGSSHGESRMIRLLYEDVYYVKLVKSAYDEWYRVEEETGRQLLFKCGGVVFTPDGHPFVVRSQAALTEFGIETEWWEREQFAARFPQFTIDSDVRVLWQPGTGFLLASVCVATFLEAASKRGAVVLDEKPVDRIEWDRDPIEVVAGGQRFKGGKVVAAAGPWAGRLLKELELPLRVTRQQVVHFRTADPALFRPMVFPAFLDLTWNEVLYGFPHIAIEGIKVSRDSHRGEAVDPDTCSRVPDPEHIEHLREFLKERIPGAAGEVVDAQVCLYTETPDLDFVVDAHPACPNLLIAAGFSGHGFKFCALMGRILSELALEGGTGFDIGRFSLDRF